MVRKAVFVISACIAILAILLPTLQVHLQRKQYRREMRAWMRSEETLKRDTIAVDFPGVEIEDAHEISIAGKMYDVLGVIWHEGRPAWICVEDSYEKTAFREISQHEQGTSFHSSRPSKSILAWPELNTIDPTLLTLNIPNEIRVGLSEKGATALPPGFLTLAEQPPRMIQRS